MFVNVRLAGNWNQEGRQSVDWLITPMEPFTDDSGCLAFKAEAAFSPEETGKTFAWSVILDAPGRTDLCGIAAESGSFAESFLHRFFTLTDQDSGESYRLTSCRRLGANKAYRDGTEEAGIRFSVWAPHAQKVEAVLASPDANAYIGDDGRGVAKAFSMTRDASGIWSTSLDEPELSDYSRYEGARYMFKITREDGSVAYRTDIYSRCQAGKGDCNPAETDWDGKSESLESTKSCSVVKDPDVVFVGRQGGAPGALSRGDFWSHEFSSLRPVPSQLEDLIIYEMHIAGLWSAGGAPGGLRKALAMLDYIESLGVNAVELLPVSEFEGKAGWGYGSSHFHAIKYDPEGQDLLKLFVRECHRRGMVVLVDVVYNHYSPDSERVHWMYDSPRHDRNMYYYYCGSQEDYPEDFPEGGYCDNYSTGYLPNVASEMVRSMMIDSAVALLMDYHVDGFRMDLTQALHSFNVLHKDGSPVAEANENGIRFMREWARTLRLYKPDVFLLAEDHSDWNMMARPQQYGGVGFNSVWWSEWYHQLIGDASQDDSKARLLKNAGYGTAKPLRMNIVGGMLFGSPNRVVYHKSHDESGNSEHSARNIQVAVNGMLFDNTRAWGEARCRVVAGITLLSAGTPMFFMGEEVCAGKPYRHDDFLDNREDYEALRGGAGAAMFLFYRDVIRLRKENAALRSPCIDILKIHNALRLLAWRRWHADREFVVVASLSNKALDSGFTFAHRNVKGKIWQEVLNSDSVIYGGSGLVNAAPIDAADGGMNVLVPANSLLVFARIN